MFSNHLCSQEPFCPVQIKRWKHLAKVWKEGRLLESYILHKLEVLHLEDSLSSSPTKKRDLESGVQIKGTRPEPTLAEVVKHTYYYNVEAHLASLGALVLKACGPWDRYDALDICAHDIRC